MPAPWVKNAAASTQGKRVWRNLPFDPQNAVFPRYTRKPKSFIHAGLRGDRNSRVGLEIQCTSLAYRRFVSDPFRQTSSIHADFSAIPKNPIKKIHQSAQVARDRKSVV